MKVFLSSTGHDLVEYRLKASQALEKLGLQIVKMEDFGAMSEEATEACRKKIEACDLFIGIYAHQYGFISPGSAISMIEKEYEFAKTKPKLCFIVEDSYPWNPQFVDYINYQLLNNFKTRIKNEYVIVAFNTAEDLAAKISYSTTRNFLQQMAENSRGRFYHLLQDRVTLQELLRSALSILVEITKTDYNQIFMIGTDKHSKKLCAVADNVARSKQRYRFAIFDGVIGKAIDTGKLQYIPDVDKHQGYFKAVPKTRSELVVPIKIDDVYCGAFNSESEEKEYYSAQMIQSAEELAHDFGLLLKDIEWSPGMEADDLPFLHIP